MITLKSASSGIQVFLGWYPRRRDYQGKDLKHIYGANGHLRKSKLMVRASVVLSDIYML
jgi:hypothetical protein